MAEQEMRNDFNKLLLVVEADTLLGILSVEIQGLTNRNVG
jgi:hypothetical protein